MCGVMKGDELRVGFFTEDAHYLMAETSVDVRIEEFEDLDSGYEDRHGRGAVFDYIDARAVLDGEVDETEVKKDICDNSPHLLAYLNDELQEYLEENWGDNGILIERNWPKQVERKLESGEYSLEDFDLDEAMVAVAYDSDDPDDIRWSYMQDTFWERHDGPVVERPF